MTGSAAPQKATILIVDDEPFNVDYLQQLLSDLGRKLALPDLDARALTAEQDPPSEVIELLVRTSGQPHIGKPCTARAEFQCCRAHA